ncbi:hypothetical protein MSAN_00530900 [Mycena sanguinolenta]|uniref:NACHT domain-containing protein n=1 Tax=Mycena sanguinolenta TaxID=230812 RepID=A0A8H6ZBF3_9AGAR|nr:hypothetical protein MSAN_00530900 [Mycena sanguinolenta]
MTESWVRKTASNLRSRPELETRQVSPVSHVQHMLTLEEKRATPNTAMYAIEGGKELAKALENVSALIPLPFLSSFVNVGIKVLEACQDASAIEENVKDLQERAYNLVLVVVNSTIHEKTSPELRERIKALQCVLSDILADLAKIKDQRKMLLVFFPDLNKGRVDKCVGRLNEALEKFQLASQLRAELHVEDVLVKINSALLPQLDRIEAAVDRFSQPHNSPHPREDMPLPHRIFCGREDLVNEITSLLATESTSRVCITGVGGMGKTSVGLAVAESVINKKIFLKKHVFWVPCIEAKSPDLLCRILYAQLRVTAESYDTLGPLVAELDSSKQRRLLLLDNFETPWLSGEDQTKVFQILVRLAELPHIALLVTMTSGFTPQDIEWYHRPLAPLDPPAARDAFKRKYRDAAGGHGLIADGPDLDELLASIGYIPLAITLMAASGGCLGISPVDLLRDWKEEGTEMMSGNQTRSMDDTIRLSMERGIVKSNPEALQLLAILSLLPAGTIGSNLDLWASSLTPSRCHAAVKTLCTAALIELQSDGHFETSRIFVRPTIRSYMSHKGRIPPETRDQVHDACYKFVLQHKSIPDDHKFKGDLEALASEEINIQALLMEIPINAPQPNAVDALIAFSLYQAWTKSSTVVASHALAVARAQDDLHVAVVTDRRAAARRVAEAHRSLALSLLRLDQYDEACVHFEEASARFKNLPGGADLPCAGEASMLLLETRMYLEPFSAELESLAQEAQRNLSHDRTDEYHVAHGFLGLGIFLWWSQSPKEEVLDALSAAKEIFERLGCPKSIAMCLYHLARTYAFHGEYAEALPIIKDASEKAEQSGEVGVTLLRTLSANARYLIVLGCYDEASGVFARLLPLSQVVGAPGSIAQDLELLAYNCAAMMNLPGARVAYDGARIQFIKIKSTRLGGDGVDRCTDNLRRLESMAEMTQNGFSQLMRPDPMY